MTSYYIDNMFVNRPGLNRWGDFLVHNLKLCFFFATCEISAGKNVAALPLPLTGSSSEKMKLRCRLLPLQLLLKVVKTGNPQYSERSNKNLKFWNS